ncbi:MAG: NAD(P)-binding domain-containing protein, partial [Clostridiales bacterium]|nr:NAD(P)-binding domain-containing protein [Clostridiales bacterium]
MKKSINTVALIGLGAIGGYLANYLQKAVGYENLRIIASGSRKIKIERDGLLVNGNPVSFRVVSPEEIMEPADLVIIITKFNALPQAILDVKNQIGEDTIIMSPLNGIESEDLVAKEYGYEKMLYSFARVSVNMTGNELTFDPNFAFMEFGEKMNTEITNRVSAVSELFDKAGIKYKIPEDMILAIWGKFMCNVSENQVTAVLHIPF